MLHNMLKAKKKIESLIFATKQQNMLDLYRAGTVISSICIFIYSSWVGFGVYFFGFLPILVRSNTLL